MEMVKRSTNPGEVLPIETCVYTALTNRRWLFWMLGWDIGGCQDPSYRPKHRTCTRETCEACVEMETMWYFLVVPKEGLKMVSHALSVNTESNPISEISWRLAGTWDVLLGIFSHGSTRQVSWTALHFHKLPTNSRMKSFGIGMLRILCHQWSSKWRSFWASRGYAASETVTPQGEHD